MIDMECLDNHALTERLGIKLELLTSMTRLLEDRAEANWHGGSVSNEQDLAPFYALMLEIEQEAAEMSGVLRERLLAVEEAAAGTGNAGDACCDADDAVSHGASLRGPV